MIFILGILDFIAGVNLILLKFHLAEKLAWFFVGYLAVKGLIFLPDLNSIIDIFAALIMIIAIFGAFSTVSWIIVIWLMQKAVFSLF